MYGPGTLAFSVGPGRGQTRRSRCELLDHAEAARRRSSPMTACRPRWSWAGGPKRRGGVALELDAVEEAVEGEVEVEPGLLAVGDHVEAGGDLVVDGGDDGVVLQLAAVVGAELVEVGARRTPASPGNG